MFKVRVLLVLEVAIMFFLQLFVSEIHWYPNAMLFFKFFFITLMITGVNMLLFSFVRVDKTPTGALCFNPKNPYWRLMKWIYPKHWGKQMSLCRTHWMTELVVVTTIAALMVLFFAWQAGLWASLKIVAAIVLIAVFFALVIIFGVGAGTVVEKVFSFVGQTMWYRRHKIVIDKFGIGGTALAVILCPSFLTMKDYGLDFVTALLVVFKYIVFGIWSLAGVVGAILCILWICARFVDFVGSSAAFVETSFGQTIAGIKNNLCPTVYECSINTNQKE